MRPLYRATLYLDDGDDAAVDTASTQPQRTINRAIVAARRLAADRGWTTWSGTVNAGSFELWQPEPGIAFDQFVEDEDARVAYFGADWAERS